MVLRTFKKWIVLPVTCEKYKEIVKVILSVTALKTALNVLQAIVMSIIVAILTGEKGCIRPVYTGRKPKFARV